MTLEGLSKISVPPHEPNEGARCSKCILHLAAEIDSTPSPSSQGLWDVGFWGLGGGKRRREQGCSPIGFLNSNLKSQFTEPVETETVYWHHTGLMPFSGD